MERSIFVLGPKRRKSLKMIHHLLLHMSTTTNVGNRGAYKVTLPQICHYNGQREVPHSLRSFPSFLRSCPTGTSNSGSLGTEIPWDFRLGEKFPNFGPDRCEELVRPFKSVLCDIFVMDLTPGPGIDVRLIPMLTPEVLQALRPSLYEPGRPPNSRKT